MMRDKDLDDLLGLAARDRPLPAADLIDRVLAEGLALQPQPVPLAAASPTRQAGWLSRLAAAFGGAPALAGVGSAMVLGLAVGYLDPATLDNLTGGLTGGLTGTEAGTLDLFPSADFLTTEG